MLGILKVNEETEQKSRNCHIHYLKGGNLSSNIQNAVTCSSVDHACSSLPIPSYIPQVDKGPLICLGKAKYTHAEE